MRPGNFNGGFHGGDTWQRWLFVLLIVVALVAGAILLARMWMARPPVGRTGPPPPPNPALTELDLRYARGEVTREEYLQRRADLLGHIAPPPGPPGASGPPAAPGAPPPPA
jgi:putative membrane protein